MKAITSPGACRAARLICVFLSFLLLTLAPVFATAQPTMRVHFINVGQGAASLLEFSCGAVLIDAGGEENDEVHSGDDLMAYLDAFFARRTDLKRRLSSFMLTHPHKDHTAGVEKVVAAFKPRNAVTNGQYYGSGKKGQLALREYSWGRDRREGTSDDVPYQWVRLEDLPAEHGYSDAIVDPVKCADIDPVITILWGQVTTPRDWGYSFGKPRYANSNNHSLAIRVRFGQSSILWTGDMEEVAIEEFVARYRNTTELDVDVYEAGHHGSRNGTTRALLEAMTPTISVISMGTIDQEVQWRFNGRRGTTAIQIRLWWNCSSRLRKAAVHRSRSPLVLASKTSRLRRSLAPCMRPRGMVTSSSKPMIRGIGPSAAWPIQERELT
jgi:competence protein ComEC